MAAPSGPPTLFLSAGDTSGDLHGAAVVRELRKHLPDLRCVAFGGEALKSAGVELLEPLANNPVMGFSRVFASLGHFLGLLSAADRLLRATPPDLMLLIDYPGFNVNLAHLAHRQGIPTCYYICPQYWGWAPWRGRRFARAVDQALVIFPFEEPYFASLGVPVQCVGHPVADRVAPFAEPPRERRDVALLPGSRRLEVERHLDWMLEAAERLNAEVNEQLHFCSTHPRADVRRQLEQRARARGLSLQVRDQPLPELLAGSRLALVSSGTATLEAALLEVPSVVLYRVTRPLLLASRFLLTSPFIAQPNLLAGHEVFPEFLTADNPAREMSRRAAALLVEGPEREQCLATLARLRRRLLHPGADARAAQAISQQLNTALNKAPTPGVAPSLPWN